MQKISIVVPLFNEEEVVKELYRRIHKTLLADFDLFDWEIIFVDDGSTDKTLTELKALRHKNKKIKVLSFSRNFGHHIAITAGLDYATGDYIVMMDGDLQDRPEDIKLLFNKLNLGFDVVYGIRRDKQFGIFKKVTSNIFNALIKSMMRENIVINSTIFRIMTRNVANHVKELRENNRYIIGLIGWVGFKHAGQDVTHGKRYCGESKYNFIKQIELAINAIVSFTDYPLVLASRLGFFMVIISAILTFYILVKKIIFNTPIVGWTSLFVAILFFNGIQTIILGIIGEYLGRNYLESKRRSLYIIREKIGLKNETN